MDSDSKRFERETVLVHLNKIIATQERIANAVYDFDKFMQLVVDQMQNLTPATGVVVELVDGDEMVFRAASGSVANHVGLRLAKAHSISGLCVKEKKVLRSDDSEHDPRVNAAACRLIGARSLVVAPLFHNGKSVGVIKIVSNQPNAFLEEDVQTLELMAGLIGSALAHQIEHKSTQHLLDERTQALIDLQRSEKKLKHMANFDFLTDLANRHYFREKLVHAMQKSQRKKELLAVFYLDIDYFKYINDTYGHPVGDELLKAFAGRIKSSIRETDLAARMGGDEFVILLNNLETKENAIGVAKKIIEHMQTNFCLKTINLKISTSIGLAFLENDTITADELIKRADDALYVAKKNGRNNYKVYDAQCEQEVTKD